jgi:hypothetical protein
VCDFGGVCDRHVSCGLMIIQLPVSIVRHDTTINRIRASKTGVCLRECDDHLVFVDDPRVDWGRERVVYRGTDTGFYSISFKEVL